MSIRPFTLAIEFEGFNLPKSGDDNPRTQPPILNPKTGEPYNLEDNHFPVVKDHKFKWYYWQMPRTLAKVQLEYLKEHWTYFNKTRFHGVLKPCEIALLRDVNAARMQLRGVWHPPHGPLRISPNLFNAPHEGWVNRILIHEMCHQYVSEVHGVHVTQEHYKTKGHGSEWQAAMRMAGLPPDRFDSESNWVYMDRHEKKNDKLKAWRQTTELVKKTHKKATDIRIGAVVSFVDIKGVFHTGVIKGRGAKPKRWVVETLSSTPTLIFENLHQDFMLEAKL